MVFLKLGIGSAIQLLVVFFDFFDLVLFLVSTSRFPDFDLSVLRKCSEINRRMSAYEKIPQIHIYKHCGPFDLFDANNGL
jgi:hypothetical protein